MKSSHVTILLLVLAVVCIASGVVLEILAPESQLILMLVPPGVAVMGWAMKLVADQASAAKVDAENARMLAKKERKRADYWQEQTQVKLNEQG